MNALPEDPDWRDLIIRVKKAAGITYAAFAIKIGVHEGTLRDLRNPRPGRLGTTQWRIGVRLVNFAAQYGVTPKARQQDKKRPPDGVNTTAERT